MKLHPRTLPVQRADSELRHWLIEWQDRHDLTDVEALRSLLSAAERHSKYVLRAERHPDDPERKADEA